MQNHDESGFQMKVKKILFIGEQWFGSDARSLAFALRRSGQIVSTVDPIGFFPHSTKVLSKILRRILMPVYLLEYNQAILLADRQLNPDVVVVFKGASVSPKTLDVLKDRRRLLVQFYPDTSLFAYGRWIPECVPKYDFWFTTKSFGVAEVKSLSSSTEVILVNHAFDPDVHTAPDFHSWEQQQYICDVSFIGTWDFEKEQFLADVVRQLPNLKVKIWGSYWNRSKRSELTDCIQGGTVTGDLYTLSLRQSRINLGLLRKKQKGGVSGDLVTARTFQIPAVGGFMMHERTEEALALFEEGVHASYFNGVDELVQKIRYYLSNSSEREKIRKEGHLECIRSHCMDRRAEFILDRLLERKSQKDKVELNGQ